MIGFKLLALHEHLSLLDNEIAEMEARPKNSPLSDADIEKASGILDKIMDENQNIDLIFDDAHLEYLLIAVLERLERGEYNSTSLRQGLTDFRSNLEIVLRAVNFVFIPRERANCFEQNQLFGKEVFTAFPSAKYDIKEAGNCFATGAFTASVFHLMRTAEYGLRALAKDFKVTIKSGPVEFQEWHTVIENIEARITNISKQKMTRAARTNALEFYRGAVAEFRDFKDVWRNHVMHTRVDYNQHTAKNALEHVRDFMQRLAKKLSEDRKGSLRWK
jgi:nucleoside diphosphate kinase